MKDSNKPQVNPDGSIDQWADPSVILVTGSETMVEQKMTEAYALGLKHAAEIVKDSKSFIEAITRIENLKNKQEC